MKQILHTIVRSRLFMTGIAVILVFTAATAAASLNFSTDTITSTGTINLSPTGQPVVINGDLDLGTNGMTLSATNGVLSLLGLGTGADQDLTIDLDSENKYALISSDSVEYLVFNSSINSPSAIHSTIGVGDEVNYSDAVSDIWVRHDSGAAGQYAQSDNGAAYVDSSADPSSARYTAAFGSKNVSLKVLQSGARLDFSQSPTAFADLGAENNGILLYCADCAIANPCTGGGTGAFAKRLNNTWICN